MRGESRGGRDNLFYFVRVHQFAFFSASFLKKKKRYTVRGGGDGRGDIRSSVRPPPSPVFKKNFSEKLCNLKRKKSYASFVAFRAATFCMFFRSLFILFS